MREVLEANERRQLVVIEHLYSSEEWLTLKDLAQRTASSERILKQDIVQLREKFSKEVLQTSHRGIRLVLPPHKNIDEIYRFALENSLAFNFIEKLIYDETKTVAELAEELFISSSTLFRLIKKLNVSLVKYYVQIQTNPCKLVSESEDSIRYFYISYFSERYNSIDWPYKTINQNFFEQLLLLLARVNHIPLDFPDFKRLKLWTAISFLRAQQGNYTAIQSSNYTDMIPDFSKFQPVTGMIEKKLAITLDKAFIEQVFSIFINNHFAFSYESLMEEAKKNSLVKKNVFYHADLLHNLSSQIGIPIPNFNHLLKEMYNISNFAFKSKKGQYPPPFILFDQKKLFVHSIKELFPDFIKTAYSTLKLYEKNIHETFSESAKYEIIYTMIIQWDHLIPELYNQKEKIQLLIVSDFDLEHAKMIQHLLHHYFRQEITTEIYTKPNFSMKQMKKLSYDVLVTTFTLPIEYESIEENCICIQNIPTKRNIESIRNAIEEQYKLKGSSFKHSAKKSIQF